MTTDFASSDDRGFAVALQADGRIVVAGQAFVSDHDVAVARYNSDGSLDTSFGGGDGKVTTDVAVGEDDAAHAVAIQADGKIVAAGYVRNVVAEIDPEDFAVARYNLDGSPDLTFGVGGKVTTDFASSADRGNAVALQADGKIVVSGQGYSTNRDFGLARYNTNGSLDATFDGDGMVTTDFGSTDLSTAVAIQGDGKIVAVGFAVFLRDFLLARYNTNGSLDTAFDGDGKVTTDFGGTDHSAAVAIQADGKIVAAGVSAGDFALARYRADGSPDTIFGGGDGKVTTDFGGMDAADGIAIRGDRRLVAVGCTSCSDASDFAVARYKICRTSSRRSSIPC